MCVSLLTSFTNPLHHLEILPLVNGIMADVAYALMHSASRTVFCILSGMHL